MNPLILFTIYLISGIFLFAIFLKIFTFWNKIPHVEATELLYWVEYGILFISLGLIASSFSSFFFLDIGKIFMSVGGVLFIVGLIFFMIGSYKSLNFILRLIS